MDVINGEKTRLLGERKNDELKPRTQASPLLAGSSYKIGGVEDRPYISLVTQLTSTPLIESVP